MLQPVLPLDEEDLVYSRMAGAFSVAMKPHHQCSRMMRNLKYDNCTIASFDSGSGVAWGVLMLLGHAAFSD
jgi:putative hemolysin